MELRRLRRKAFSTMLPHAEKYRDKHVVIAGGGDSAVDWALSLSEIAASVKLVHRRPKFRAAPGMVDKLHALDGQGVLELVVPYQLSGLQGDDGILSGVEGCDFGWREALIRSGCSATIFRIIYEPRANC